MTEELRPVRCGCGGEAKVYSYDALSGHYDYYVNCTKCGICTPSKPTKAEAIKVWNKAMRGNEIGESSVRMLEWLAQPLTK